MPGPDTKLSSCCAHVQTGQQIDVTVDFPQQFMVTRNRCYFSCFGGAGIGTGTVNVALVDGEPVQ